MHPSDAEYTSDCSQPYEMVSLQIRYWTSLRREFWMRGEWNARNIYWIRSLSGFGLGFGLRWVVANRAVEQWVGCWNINSSSQNEGGGDAEELLDQSPSSVNRMQCKSIYYTFPLPIHLVKRPLGSQASFFNLCEIQISYNVIQVRFPSSVCSLDLSAQTMK